jgi:ubiquinone/menaquinone biosynthesis C-methylase UbiE
VPYKFHPHQKHKLDSDERRRLLPPHETLRRLGLRQGEVVADVGCGIGYFSIPAAEIVGDSGWVYALDTSEEMLQELRTRLRSQGVRNVEPRSSVETTLGLPDGSVSFVFLSNMLHEVVGLEEFLSEVLRILQSHGRVAVIEWKKIPTGEGPPLEHRLSAEEVRGSLHRAGFVEASDLEINRELYGVTARKGA